MESESYSLEDVDRLIDFLQNKIETNTITAELLDALQQRVDAIDSAYRDDPAYAQYYPHLLELQTLIYGESNQEGKALQFLKEAVRQTGSVSGLYSNLLQDYIALHTPQPVPVPVAVDEPEEPEAPEIPVEAPVQAHHRKHASLLHIRLSPSRKLRVAFAAAFGLVVLSVATAHFAPQAAALPVMLTKHGEIANAKQAFDSLTAQYNQCSAQLAGERGSVDTYDTAEVDAYNQATRHCQTVLQEQHQAADRYNALIGKN